MKKLKILLLALTILSITFIVIYWILPNPINDLNSNEVKSIAIYSVDGKEIIDYLTDNEAKDLINIVNSAKYFKIGSDKYKYYLGENEKMFCIEMQDTTKIDLASTHYLVIDNKGYRCDDATLNFIKQLYRKYEAEHYPIAVK